MDHKAIQDGLLPWPYDNEEDDISHIDVNIARDVIEQLAKHGRCVQTGLLATPEILDLLLAVFKCRRCGLCCNQYQGEKDLGISVSETEIAEIASFVNRRPRRIKRLCTEQTSGLFLLPKPCLFYRDKSCQVYAIRPIVCRHYPFRARIYYNYARLLDRHPLIDIDPCCPSGKKMAHWLVLTKFDLIRRVRYNILSSSEWFSNIPKNFTGTYNKAFDIMVDIFKSRKPFSTVPLDPTDTVTYL